jgi:hypothetical protein
MTNGELRDRLAASNPSPPNQPVDPIGSDRARALMEDIMSTTITKEPQVKPKRPRFLALAAAAASLAVVSALALFGGLAASSEPLQLTATPGDPMAMCLAFDVATLRGMSPAFGGTVTAVTGDVATLEVNRWYAGGDAETVQIQFTPGMEALIGTPSFEVGQQYLITATDGVVNSCGYSGLATPEYEAAWAEAFGA